MESEWVEMVLHSNGNHSQEYICAGKFFGNFLSCLHEEVAYETLYSFDMGRHSHEALGLVDNTDTVSSLSCVYPFPF